MTQHLLKLHPCSDALVSDCQCQLSVGHMTSLHWEQVAGWASSERGWDQAALHLQLQLPLRSAAPPSFSSLQRLWILWAAPRWGQSPLPFVQRRAAHSMGYHSICPSLWPLSIGFACLHQVHPAGPRCCHCHCSACYPWGKDAREALPVCLASALKLGFCLKPSPHLLLCSQACGSS